MFRLLLIVLLVSGWLYARPGVAQAPRWLQTVNGSDDDFVKTVAVDGAGNTYVSGSFAGSTTVGGTVLQTSSQSSGTFVAKYSPQGNLLWIRQLGVAVSRSQVECLDLAADASGNVVVAGYFSGGPLSFGGTTLPSTASGPYSENAFVARLNAQGTVVWLRAVPHPSGDARASALALDAAGVACVAGTFDNSAPFVAKYLTDGTRQWLAAGPASASAVTYISSVAVTTGGQLAITGVAFNDAVALPSTASSAPSLVVTPTAGGAAGFVAAYSAAGVAQWVQVLSAPVSASLNHVAALGADWVVAGYYRGAASLGSAPGASLSAPDTISVAVVARFSGQGVRQWVASARGSSQVAAFDVAVDNQSNILIGGTFAGQLDASGRSMTSAGAGDVFLLAYSPQGTLLGGQRDGGPAYDDLWSFDLSPAGELRVVGTYWGSTTLAGTALAAPSGADGFVAKFVGTPLATRPGTRYAGAFTAAPSPARTGESWQLCFDQEMLATPATVRVLNVLGQEVRTLMLPAHTVAATVRTTGLPAGRYTLQVIGAAGMLTKSVVVE